MKKILKWASIILGGLLVLLIALILVLPHVIDFNKYKGQIEDGIYRASGYEVTLEGDIDLFFIPWLGIDAGEAKVANPPGFDPEYLASVNDLRIRLRVLPLIRGEIKMQRVVFQGLELDLIIDEEGRPNWLVPEPEQEHVESGGIALAHAREQNPEPNEPEGFTLPDVDIAGVEISESSISFRNLASGQQVQITDLNLLTGRIVPDQPIDLQTDMRFKNFDPVLEGALDMNAQAQFAQDQGRVDLSEVDLVLDLEGEPLPEPIENGEVRGDVLYFLQENRVEVSGLWVHALDMELRGELSGTDLDTLPRVTFDLEGDNLDLDRFLPEEESGSSGSNPGNNPGSNPEEEGMDLSFLHEFVLNGNIKLTNLKASGALIDQLEAQVASGDGELELSQIRGRLYDGSLEGQLNLREEEGEAYVKTQQSMRDVQVGPLLRDAADQDLLTGRLDLDADLDTFGTTPDLFKENLAGQSSVEVQEGTIKGMDLDRMIRRGFALAFGDSGPSEEEEATTGFSTLKGSFDIDSGIAVSEDLELYSPVLGVTGNLRLDLPESYLESRSRVFVEGSLKQELERRYSVPDQALPLRVEGKFDDLSVRLDVEDILRDTLRKKGEDMLRKLLNGADPEEEDAKDPVEEKTRELLESIF